MEKPEGEVLIYASHKIKNTSSTILFPAKDFQLICLTSVINDLCKQKNSSIPYLRCSQKGEIWLWHSNKGTNSRKFSYWCGHRRNLAGRPAHTVHRLNIMVLTSTVRLVHIRCYKKRERSLSRVPCVKILKFWGFSFSFLKIHLTFWATWINVFALK